MIYGFQSFVTLAGTFLGIGILFFFLPNDGCYVNAQTARRMNHSHIDKGLESIGRAFLLPPKPIDISLLTRFW